VDVKPNALPIERLAVTQFVTDNGDEQIKNRVMYKIELHLEKGEMTWDGDLLTEDRYIVVDSEGCDEFGDHFSKEEAQEQADELNDEFSELKKEKETVKRDLVTFIDSFIDSDTLTGDMLDSIIKKCTDLRLSDF